MSNMKDLVSIIMPSFNTADFIAESIESVLKQTHDNWELIIIDDCSTDHTDEVLEKFKDNRIIYKKNNENKGAAQTRNIALSFAQGKWIAFLDSDDVWSPQKLESQIKFMYENSYQFSCTYSAYIDEDSTSMNLLDTCPKHINRLGLYLYNWISSSTVMYNRELVGLVQIADLRKRNDYAMWLKVIRKFDCFCLTEDLGAYRVRRNSLAHDSFTKLVMAHYLLFRVGDNRLPMTSIVFTIINMVFGFIRKKIYIRKTL